MRLVLDPAGPAVLRTLLGRLPTSHLDVRVSPTSPGSGRGRSRGLCLAGLVALGTALSGHPVHGWEYVRDGVFATSVVLDDSGDVFSAGVELGDGVEIVVVRHSGADGSEQWRYVLNSGGPSYNSGASLAQGPDGSLFVSSYQRERYGAYTGFVAKIAPEEGTEIWKATFTDHVGFYSVTVDSSNDVVVAGAISEAQPTDHDLIAIKLSGSNGTEIWRHVLTGSFDNVFDTFRAAVVNVNDDVFVAGSVSANVALGYPDFVVLKLSGSEGTQVWRGEIRSVSSHGGDAYSLAIDGNGGVVAAGSAVLVDWCDFVVAKFSSSDGAELWRAVVDEPSVGSCDVARSVAIDPWGDVIATGAPRVALFSTMKFSGATGALLWRHDIPNPGLCTGGGCAGGVSVQTDANGNTLVTGTVAGNAGGELAIAKLAADDGTELWRRVIDYEGCDDVPIGLAIDGRGDVVVGGWVFVKIDGVCAWPQGSQYAVFKSTGESGKDYWEGCYDDRDNDDDGFIDFPNDPGCRDASFLLEDPACQDGIDNDGRVGIDFDGGASANGGVPLAEPDPQCIGMPSRLWEGRVRCGLGFELSLVLVPLLWIRMRRLPKKVLAL